MYVAKHVSATHIDATSGTMQGCKPVNGMLSFMPDQKAKVKQDCHCILAEGATATVRRLCIALGK